MINPSTDIQSVYRMPALTWIFLSVASIAMIVLFYDGVVNMVNSWNTDEYSHGIMIPFIVLFLIWQKKDRLEQVELTGSWWGLLLVLLGILLFYVGELSSIYTLIQYGFLVAIIGVLLSLLGVQAFRLIWVPLLILIFMVPLPNFLFFNLSSQLQLISSKIGVAVIRLFDISVYLEGNVIDLGTYKLQVVEACSGLNYLFPLMTLGFIAAYFFTGALWKKVVIFLSTIPITVFMNSFRIGVIGVTVEYWGQEMAEGFLHDFEGWFVFMTCTFVLIIEMWILASIGKNKLPLRDAFGMDTPEPTPEDAERVRLPIPRQLYISSGILIIMAAMMFSLPERVEQTPDRKEFVYFPMQFDEWQGKKGYLESIYIDALKFTDYIMSDYTGIDGGRVNFYSAYYASQKKGASIHSPASCIPGGGWRISSHDSHHQLSEVTVDGVPLVVNRLVIQKGESKQLVYYWFQQRGRIINNEYLMKWFLFWDSMVLNRSDGALMRMTTFLEPGQDLSIADRRLESFARAISPIVPEYVPSTL